MAAHFQDRKLSRPQIFATDISESVESIVHPTVPLALRVSGHLLLGVVRIYSRKVHYLWQDCHQAMVQIQMAFLQQPNNAQQTAIDMDGGKENKRKRRTRSELHDNEAVDETMDTADVIPATTALQGFGIPFDLNDDSFNNAEDWAPAELVDAYQQSIPSQRSPQKIRKTFDSAPSDFSLHTMETDSLLDSRAAVVPEEQWTAFDPDDEDPDINKLAENKKRPSLNKTGAETYDQHEFNPTDPEQMEQDQELNPIDHSISQAEVMRANESEVSEMESRRSLALIDRAAGEASTMEPDLSFPQDVSGIPILDEDELAPAQGSRPSSLRADQSSLSSVKPQDESSAAAISLGVTSTPSEGKANKRKSGDKSKKRKRRKIVFNQDEIELTSAEIRNMLGDTSDIVIRPVLIGQEQDEDDLNLEYKGLAIPHISQILMNALSYEQLFQRPALADDGGLAPKLLDVWTESSRLRDLARQDAAVGNTRTSLEADSATERSEARTKVGEESFQSDGSVEAVREQHHQEKGEMESLPLTPVDQDYPPFPPDNLEQDAPIAPEEEEFPLLPADDEPPQQPVFDEEEEEQEMDENDKRQSSLSLGLVNTLGEDLDWEEQLDQEGARQEAGDEIVTSNAKWHKHTIKVYSLLKNRIAQPGSSTSDKKAPNLYYNSLVDGCSRRTAVGVFFELLQLKTWDFIELNQEESYGDITITAGVKFAEPVPK